MQRKILVIAVIALVAVAVFGSQALADKPETIPSNLAMTETLNSINQTVTDTQSAVAAIEAKVNEMDAKWDGMVKMESYSGTAVLLPGNTTYPVEETYPEVRHVSLTLSVFPLLGWDADDFVYVLDKGVIHFIGGLVLSLGEGGLYYATVEFDTTAWSIWAYNGETDGGPWPVDYNYTVTYPE